jgi:hypothetical protein
VNFIVNTVTGGTGRLFENAATQWYTMHYDALCYRALSSKELADELATPVKPAAQGPYVSREPAPYSGSVPITPGGDKPLPIAGVEPIPGQAVAAVSDDTKGPCCHIVTGGGQSNPIIYEKTKKECREFQANLKEIGGYKPHSFKFCWGGEKDPCGKIKIPLAGEEGFTLGATWEGGSAKCGDPAIQVVL